MENIEHLKQVEQSEWYQFPWVWALICIPFTAVLFGVVMFVMADIHRDDLVVDDYYKDGMAINLRLSMDERAKELGVRAKMAQVNERGVSWVIENVSDSAIQMSLYHVTNSTKDLITVLIPEDDMPSKSNLYLSDNPDLVDRLTSKGVWFVELSGVDDGWRLRNRIVTPLTQLELVP